MGGGRSRLRRAQVHLLVEALKSRLVPLFASARILNRVLASEKLARDVDCFEITPPSLTTA